LESFQELFFIAQ